MKYFYLKSTQNDAEAKNSYKLITLTLNTYEFQLKFSGGGGTILAGNRNGGVGYAGNAGRDG